MADDYLASLIAAYQQESSSEELYKAFQEDVDHIIKKGEAELEVLRQQVDKRRIDELKDNIAES